MGILSVLDAFKAIQIGRKYSIQSPSGIFCI